MLTTLKTGVFLFYVYLITQDDFFSRLFKYSNTSSDHTLGVYYGAQARVERVGALRLTPNVPCLLLALYV